MTNQEQSGYQQTLDAFSGEAFAAFAESRERWNALRMRSVLDMLERHRGFRVEGRKVLEFGCGTGAGTRALAEAGAIATGVDPYARLIEIARERAGSVANASFRQIDGGLPFADGEFDLVVSLEVLEHVPVGERPIFLAEFRRVLDDRGLGYISYPNFWFPLEQHYHRPFHHWRQRLRPRQGLVYEDIPSKYTVRNALREYFQLTDLTPDFVRSSYVAARYGWPARLAARLFARTPLAPQDYLLLEPRLNRQTGD